jgi:hypothetical protein
VSIFFGWNVPGNAGTVREPRVMFTRASGGQKNEPTRDIPQKKEHLARDILQKITRDSDQPRFFFDLKFQRLRVTARAWPIDVALNFVQLTFFNAFNEPWCGI